MSNENLRPPDDEYIPVVWVSRAELLEAIAGFEDDILALSDEEQAELSERLGDALKLVYLNAIPDLLIDVLGDLARDE